MNIEAILVCDQPMGMLGCLARLSGATVVGDAEYARLSSGMVAVATERLRRDWPAHIAARARLGGALLWHGPTPPDGRILAQGQWRGQPAVAVLLGESLLICVGQLLVQAA